MSQDNPMMECGHAANARLIAAAPELLEVLKDLVGILKEVIDDAGLHPAGGLYKTAIELIARAEGTKP